MLTERYTSLFNAFGIPVHQRTPEALIRICTQSLKTEADTGAVLLARAEAYMDIGNYQAAVSDLDEAISLGIGKGRPEAFARRGVCKLNLGGFYTAISDLDHALEFFPEAAWLYCFRGMAHFSVKDTENALADFTAAIRLDEQDADFYFHRGNVHFAILDWEQAVRDFTACLRLAPDMAEAYAQRGASRAALGNYRDALLDFNRAHQLLPDSPRVLEARSSVHQALGDLRQAHADLEQARQLEMPLSMPRRTIIIRSSVPDEFSDPELEAYDDAESDLLWAMEEGEYFYDDDEPHAPSDYW